jgi:hypothetical protein
MHIQHALLSVVIASGLVGCVPPSVALEVPLSLQEAPGVAEVVLLERSLPVDFYDDALVHSLRVINAYLALSDLITSEEGAQPERMEKLVSAQWYSKEQEGFEHYRLHRERTSGATFFEDYVIQMVRITPEKTLDVGVFGCVDTSQVIVLAESHPELPELVSQWHPDYDGFDGDESEWEEITQFYELEGLRFGDRRAIIFWLTGETFDGLVVDNSSQWWGAHTC